MLQEKTLEITFPLKLPSQQIKKFIGEVVLQTVRKVSLTVPLNILKLKWVRMLVILVVIWIQVNNLQSLHVHVERTTEDIAGSVWDFDVDMRPVLRVVNLLRLISLEGNI